MARTGGSSRAVIDRCRLSRALGLEVRRLDRNAFRVRGGAAPHVVHVRPGSAWACDCPDAAYRPGGRCKHVVAVYLHRQLASPVRQALRVAVEGGS